MGCPKLDISEKKNTTLKVVHRSLEANCKRRAGAYPFGFNGMEKEDEISGTSGGHLDFGARIYDSRTGRWLSVDPLYKKYPGESPYMYAGDNPVVYIDKEGETKVIYLTVIDKDGTENTIAVVDDEYIKYETVRSTDWLDPKQEVRIEYAYDVEEHYTYDSRTGKLTQGETKLHSRGPAMIDKFKRFANNIQGKGEKVKGGIYRVSEDGGIDPTKNYSDNDVGKADLGDLLVFSSALKSISNIKLSSKADDMLREATNITQKINQHSLGKGGSPYLTTDGYTDRVLEIGPKPTKLFQYSDSNVYHIYDGDDTIIFKGENTSPIENKLRDIERNE